MGLFSSIGDFLFGKKSKEVNPSKIWPKNVTPAFQTKYSKQLATLLGNYYKNIMPTLGQKIPLGQQEQQSLGILGNYLNSANPDYSAANKLVSQWMQPNTLDPQTQAYMQSIQQNAQKEQQLGAHSIAQNAQLFGDLGSSGVGNALASYYSNVEPKLNEQLSGIRSQDLNNRRKMALSSLPYSMQLANEPQANQLRKIQAGMQYGAAPYKEAVRARNEQFTPMSLGNLPFEYNQTYMYPKLQYPQYTQGSSGFIGGMAGGVGAGLGTALGKLL